MKERGEVASFIESLHNLEDAESELGLLSSFAKFESTRNS